MSTFCGILQHVVGWRERPESNPGKQQRAAEQKLISIYKAILTGFENVPPKVIDY